MIMISNGKYRHTYTSTASDITPLYRLTPNALLMYFQDSFARLMTIHNVAAFDIVKQRRMWVITEIQMNIQPTACELMSRWQPQPETPDVSEVLDREL